MIPETQQHEDASADGPGFPNWLTPSQLAKAPVLVDRQQAEAYARLLFEGMTGFVNLRAIKQDTQAPGPPVKQYWPPIDANLPTAIADYCEDCAKTGYAAFLVPFAVAKGTSNEKGLLTTRVLPIDLDECDVDAGIENLKSRLGEPALIVYSGGVNNQGQRKAHIYYRLAEDVLESGFGALKQLRLKAAVTCGGDMAVAKNFGQPLRIPGSKHFKKGISAACSLATVNSTSYSLAEIAAKIGVPPRREEPNPLDFNNVTALSVATMERVLTEAVHEGAVDDINRYDAFKKAGGHYIKLIRDPVTRWSEADALQATLNWNEATLIPPWPEERLRREFQALLKVDIKNHGALPAVQSPANEWARFDEWTGDAFVGAAPKRKYLIDGVLPLSQVAAICASGGQGKSYLMLDLALRVATGAPAMGMDFNNNLIFGGEVCEFGTAVVFFSEDDKVTIHERLAALDPEQKRAAAKGRLRPIPMPNMGGSRALFVESRGAYSTTPEFEAIRAWLKSLPELKLVCFDPLQTIAAIDITAKPEAGQFVMSSLGALAVELSATVLVTHHLKKTDKAISSPDEARAAIRGSTALVDGVRWAYALWSTERAPGADICAEGAVVKSNGARDEGTHQYRRLPCGVLRQVPASYSPDARAGVLSALAAAIGASARSGTPFTLTGPNGLFDQRHRLPANCHRLSRSFLETAAQELLNSGQIVKGTARGGGGKGRSWLDVPDGDYAMGNGIIMAGAGSVAA